MTKEISFSNQQINSIIPNQKTFDPLFVYYALSMLAPDVASLAAGAATPIINKSRFSELTIRVPPLFLQSRIASILSAYDDLIENNTQRIAILEAMARALYHEWFVHFRFPGHEDVPLVDSHLGPIPEGWEVAPFGQIARVQGGSLDPSQYPSEVFAHFSFPAFDADQMPTLEQGSEILSNKLRFEIPCVLLAKLNPRIPRIWPVVTASHATPICSTEFLPLMAGEPFSPSLLAAFCKTPEFGGRFKSMALGTSTSHQRVKPRDLGAMPVVVALPRTTCPGGSTDWPCLYACREPPAQKPEPPHHARPAAAQAGLGRDRRVGAAGGADRGGGRLMSAALGAYGLGFSEDALVEQPAIQFFRALGWEVGDPFDPVWGPRGSIARESEHEVVLLARLRPALEHLNPDLPKHALELAIEELTRDRSALSDVAANQDVYRWIRDGVKVRRATSAAARRT
jgi:hypothetical protein